MQWFDRKHIWFETIQLRSNGFHFIKDSELLLAVYAVEERGLRLNAAHDFNFIEHIYDYCIAYFDIHLPRIIQ